MMSVDASTITMIGVVLGAAIATLFIFLLLIGVGFWMGRQVAEKPLPSIITKKSDPPMIEEDPWFEPMHGKPQNRIPTVDGGKA
jgi:hypothetical protein